MKNKKLQTPLFNRTTGINQNFYQDHTESPVIFHTDSEIPPTPPPGTSDPSDHVPLTCPQTATMNGKPVLHRDGDTVLTIPSEEFHEKLLCDGIVFNCGDSCGFRCTYCFSENAMIKIDKPILDEHHRKTGQKGSYQNVVIRRRNALEFLKTQLANEDGSPIYSDPTDNRVAYSSTIVDPAANMTLLRETAAACNLILELTNWQIRLLSKSPLLKLLVEREMIPKKWHHRLILGFSIGTLDDKVAKAIERGTGLVSKRIEALRWLQDHGIRTFGMVCPSLPQEDYDAFSREICAAIGAEKCEHVWAEVINVRGASLTKTTQALREAGLEHEALRLESVSGAKNQEAWEDYARRTFLAHTRNITPGKLRFLQYITPASADWWKDQRTYGAVLIGKEAKKRLLISGGQSAPLTPLQPLDEADLEFRDDRERIITNALSSSIEAAKALREIKTYRDGLIWKADFLSFAHYCEVKWGYQKSHAYRQVEVGEFIADLSDSPQGENIPQPVNSGQIRPLLEAVPKSHQVECWSSIMAGKVPADFTGPMIKDEARKFVRKNKLAVKKPKPSRVSPKVRATRELGRLKSILAKLPQPGRFDQLLLGIAVLIDQEPEGEVETTPPAPEVHPAPVATSAGQGVSVCAKASSSALQIDSDMVAEAMADVGSDREIVGHDAPTTFENPVTPENVADVRTTA